MGNKLKKHNQELIRYLLGFHTHSNFTYVLRDALTDPEYCSWSVDDVKALAEYLETYWGIHLPQHCDNVIKEWRETNEAE